jgi:hypothetical protein
MIPVINDIDRLLQAAPSRYGEAYARSVQLSASDRAFEVALDATVSPSAIVFIASRTGFTGGTAVFTTDNGTPLSVDGDVATLVPAALMGSGCEVLVTITYQGEPHVARQSVFKHLAFDSSVPPAPTGLAAQGALASINLNWDPTNNTNIGTVEIWRALTNDLAAAAPAGETAGLARTYPDVIGAGGRFYYWIRYVSKANVLGPFNAQAGTLGTTGTGAEHLLELLKDQISESQLLASLRDRINQAVAGSEVAGDVAAALQAETDARIAAIDKEITDRLAALRDEAAAREAYVQDYTYNKVETDGALAIQAQMIAAAFTSYADQAADEAVAIAAADVRSYGYSKAAVDAAEAAQSNSITAAYRTYADGKKDEALTVAAADVRSFSYSKASTDSAISSLATTLRAEMASNGGVSEAYVQSYAYSKAQTNAAIASQTSTLSSTVGEHTTALQTQGTSINGLSGQYTVKIDNNGYVTGYGLASSYVNGIPTSAFIINAARFAVVAPGLAPKVMFVVGQIAGQAGVGVSGDLIVDDTISARHLKAESIQARHITVSGDQNNLVRDPRFQDLAWWDLTGAKSQGVAVTDWNARQQNTHWKHAVSVYMGPTQTYNEYVISRSQTMPLVPGATYLIEYEVGFSDDFNGDLSIWWHTYWVNSNTLGGFGIVPDSIYKFSDNSAIQYPSNSRGLRTISATVTLPNHTMMNGSQFIIMRQIRGGSAEIGGFTITRVVDETLIGPGTVQTKHLEIDRGGSIRNGQWDYGQGNGFFIQGAGNGHGARMSLGNSGGRQLLCDPDNNVLGLHGVDIVNPNVQTSFAIDLGDITITGQPNGSLTTGLTLSYSGGTPARHQWSLANEGPGLELRGDPASSSPTLYAQGNTRWVYGWLSVTAWSTTGASASTSAYVRIQFGNAYEM